ncbi:MAG TPA: hypothetical protein DIW31_08020 [Bacteroidales bacterium]|nr:hypothetical protein [Bacteroidales bacterium]
MKTKYLLATLFGCIIAANSLFSQEQKELSVFLNPTKVIDSDNPAIVSKAMELTKDCKTDIEKVKALFEFVRDSYTQDEYDIFVASEILKRGGNSCYKRSILLAALCRAIRIPSRLQYQYMLLKDFTFNGEKKDHLFTHGIVGIYLQGKWYLYEPVGNNAKWKVWIGEKALLQDMTVQFKPHQDCLFPSTENVVLKTFPIYFSDYADGRYDFMMKIAQGEIGFDYNIKYECGL